MFRVDPGRRRAGDELREGFWRWNPLGFTPERDLLRNEYDDQVERTLDLLERGADADEIELDLADWLRRRRGGRRAVGANASTAEATGAPVVWWRVPEPAAGADARPGLLGGPHPRGAGGGDPVRRGPARQCRRSVRAC